MGTPLSPYQECHPFLPSSLAHDLVVRTQMERYQPLADYLSKRAGIEVAPTQLPTRTILAVPAALEGGDEKAPCNGPNNRWRARRRGKDEEDLY
jgi:hypothetical protein